MKCTVRVLNGWTALVLTIGLSGCNTLNGMIEGAGRDISSLGQAISGAGDRAQENARGGSATTGTGAMGTATPLVTPSPVYAPPPMQPVPPLNSANSYPVPKVDNAPYNGTYNPKTGRYD